ncbi:putative OmpL-like beta-barrel porin-2 [Mucilaginibacter yixingensis]|uniref:Putative OmpL-like beta-barrel porin-2 n=1 Tax=Mucilaginibacter yixingensis TaxID=1295612 RepID=A0A2T5J656_9SPHI|nr:porin [Mucilaginibacter yixingensis]PTQ94030.1 putative OmpL-like beta-barrel porin-2 [Mucilaginibacter yixingensis]
MKIKLLPLLALSAVSFGAFAQDKPADPPLAISGSVDTYYKYDFSGHKNIPTSFASDQNSISIGMIDLGLKKKVGKASFVGELSFGPRGQEQSLPDAATGTLPTGVSSYHIQNLYVSYDVTDKFNLTAGYMSTFIGYEVISPVGNFNYSTSYLFTNGPFQNAGFKATYAFSDKVSLMAGIFNDGWNTYTSTYDVSTFGAQLMVAPVKGWTAYLNLATGSVSGTIFDLTTNYQITDAFKLGLNGATFSKPHNGGGYDGVALYPQLAVSSAVTFGLRGEYFETKAFGTTPKMHVTAFTATANIKGGPLTFIPEVRLDSFGNKSYSSFTDSKGAVTKDASQFSLAAVYAF